MCGCVVNDVAVGLAGSDARGINGYVHVAVGAVATADDVVGDDAISGKTKPGADVDGAACAVALGTNRDL